MSLRRRVALLAAAAVAVAVVLASALTYLLVAHQLRGQIDSQLHDRSVPLIRRFKREAAEQLPPFLGALRANPFGNLQPRPNQVRGYQQLVSSSGAPLLGSGGVTLPVSAAVRALAAKGKGSFFEDAHADGVHLRILTVGVRAAAVGHPGLAVQVAQPLTEDDHLLRRLRLILLAIALGGIALAALLGRLVANAVVAPVGRLTRAAEHVARTRDLSERIDVAGAGRAGQADEIERLAVSFNAMLDALERSMGALDASVHAQRQLVADASHELRTPITSLRTNVEILQQAANIDPADREHLFAEVVAQIEELTQLVGDLIDLARGEEQPATTEDVRLDQIVLEAVERARRHAAHTPLLVELQPTLLSGVPARLGRAANNLIDNALKYSPPGEPVEIRLTGADGPARRAQLTVRDHGPGITAADLPHVFDRFYRGAEARGRPGSGLGLAIVRQVVEQHGGSIAAEAALGGGTLMRVLLPHAEAVSEEQAPAYAAQ
ncbi:MAG TPA: HAMP domain-containing sensor histidine kinase [Solirubrobacteraceae bacterium]|nr:HAMP domain-containing sensor histidine kinase [Solirubrobacteraceae bacterium]